jgi:adenosine/AMP kinase
MAINLELVKLEKPSDINIILGQAHFIKTVEDIYEVLIGSVPGIKCAVAFSEASGDCLVRIQANDDSLKKIAQENVLKLGCGHCFLVVLKNAFPINVLNAIKNVPEVCGIFCATANEVEVVVASTVQGRGIMGVIDGFSPKGAEQDQDVINRKALLRKFGYKL